MAKTKIILETRRKKRGDFCTLKIALSHRSQTSYISLDLQITQSQWDDKKQRVINHPQQLLYNQIIMSRKIEIDNILTKLNCGRIGTAYQLRDVCLSELHPSEEDVTIYFTKIFRQVIALKRERTAQIYKDTLSRLLIYDAHIDSRTIEDITIDYLTNFDKWLENAGNRTNGRNLHFRNIRAVFNHAIDNELITYYPFRKFRIRTERTPKRSLSVEHLRDLFNYADNLYFDIFKLTFMLIGINFADLFEAGKLVDNRLEYIRKKTHKFYSIKVEPEAMEIIERYAGKEHLLFLCEKFKTKKYTSELITTQVKKYKTELTLYWMRHSWATIAASLDIPKETISHALGHGNHTITDIYIDFDMKKVDEANRKVLDYVLYNKV